VIFAVLIIVIVLGIFFTWNKAVHVNSKVEVKVETPDAQDIFIKWIAENSSRCDKTTAAIIVREALKTEMPALILALITNESSFNPTATNGDAIGLGQIKWKYWGTFLQDKCIAETVKDLYNPATNVKAINAILTKLIHDKKSIEKALIAYLGSDKFEDRLANYFLKLFLEVHYASKINS
jgi:soluble lytic murein transglycosylase-like protein